MKKTARCTSMFRDVPMACLQCVYHGFNSGFTFISIIGVCFLIHVIIKRLNEMLEIDVTPSKFIFVTSCDDIIGRKLVTALDESGFSVLAGCETRYGADKLKQQCSQNVIPVVFDIRDESSIEQACLFITRFLPPNTGLWAIIYNYQVITSASLFEWIPPRTIRDVMNVNVCSNLLICKKLLPWIRRSHGRIVMTTKDDHVGFPTWVEHEIASGSIMSFTECLRKELCKTGVSVHTVRIPVRQQFEKSRELIHTGIQRLFDDLIPETQGYYGDRYTNFITNEALRAPRVQPDETVKLYISAVKRMHPRKHYTSGHIRNYSDRLLAALPVYFSTVLCKKKVPIPEGLKWSKGLFEKTN